MKYEFHAQFNVINKKEIEDITENKGSFGSFDVPAKVNLLAQSMVTKDKSYAQVGDRNNPMGLKQLVHPENAVYNQYIVRTHRLMETLNLLNSVPNRQMLPYYSFFLSFEFILVKPYVSRDDEAFYIIDNPLKKEKVFKVPYIAPSSWKGNLREAFRQLGLEDTNEDIRILFGNSREDKDLFRSGRLHFYPTYLDKMAMEVINPHDRKTKAGKLPIYFEIAPIGTRGKFSLLYVPFDQIAQPEQKIKEQASKYLQLVFKGLKAMMLEYGFSAKKSSGYGVIEDKFLAKNGSHSGSLWMKEAPVYTEEDTKKGGLQVSQMNDWQKQLYQVKMRTEGKREETTFSSFKEMERLINKIVEVLGS
jgi:CRISPR-associated protein Cmr2